MKYIDADRLKAEIEQLKGQLIRGACAAQIEMETNCKDEAYNEVLAILDSLQQEHSKVDLDEETIREEFHTIDHQCFEEGIEGWQREKLIARYFYKLGLNAKKEE